MDSVRQGVQQEYKPYASGANDQKVGTSPVGGRNVSEASAELEISESRIQPVLDRSLEMPSEPSEADYSIPQSRIIANEDTDNLAQIAHAIDAAVSPTRGGDAAKPYQMPNIADTQNPVARLDVPFHAPKSAVPQPQDPNPKQLGALVAEVAKKHPRKRNALSKEIYQQQIGAAWSAANKRGDAVKLPAVIEAVVKYRDDQVEIADVMGKTADVKHLDDLISLLKENLPIDLQGVPVRYEKSEVLAQLQGKLEGVPEEQSGEIKQAMAQISDMQEPFIDAEQLGAILKGNLADIKGGLTEHVNSADVLYRNSGRKDIPDKLRQAAGLSPQDVVSYAFKTGVEGKRELLAGKLAESMGLSKYLLNKFPVSFENAKLGDQQNPAGIASRWLEGAEDIPQDDFAKYLHLERRVEEAKLKGEDTTHLTSRLETLKTRLVEGYQRPAPSEARRAELVESFRTKFLRAANTYRRIHDGTELGAKPMSAIYHPELIDSQHHYGRDVAPFWEIWKGSEETTDSFSDWMGKISQGIEVPEQALLTKKNLIGPGAPALNQVKYMDADERKAHEMKIDPATQQFSTGGEQQLNTSDPADHPHIFVISPDEKVYVGTYDRGRFNHSTLLAGGAVQSAGEMIFENGALVEITDKSGHYKTDQGMLLKGLQVLQSQGVDLSKVKVTVDTQSTTGQKKTYPNALEFLQNPPVQAAAGKPPAAAAVAETGAPPLIVGQESLEELTLLDMLMCSYDSHSKQYKIKDGQAQNFDFARFLAPHEAFTRGNNVHITLRSTFLDHPGTTVPLSQDRIALIKSWKPGDMIQAWKEQGLVGDEATFREAAENLETNKESFASVRERCYDQVHPKAAQRLQERMEATQAYISDCEASGEQPTLRGGFDRMYPDLAPFMKVMRRMDFNPSAAIGIHEGQQRSVQSIIDQAKQTGLATGAEITEMEQALENLKQNAATIYETATSVFA